MTRSNPVLPRTARAALLSATSVTSSPCAPRAKARSCRVSSSSSTRRMRGRGSGARGVLLFQTSRSTCHCGGQRRANAPSLPHSGGSAPLLSVACLVEPTSPFLGRAQAAEGGVQQQVVRDLHGRPHDERC